MTEQIRLLMKFVKKQELQWLKNLQPILQFFKYNLYFTALFLFGEQLSRMGLVGLLGGGIRFLIDLIVPDEDY